MEHSPNPRATDDPASAGHAVRALAEVPAVLWEADADDYRMLYVSPAALHVLGLDPERWMTEPAFWEGHIHPDDRAAAIAAADRAVTTHTRARIEYRFRHGDGGYRRMLDTMQVTVGGDGRSRLSGVMVELPAAAPGESLARGANGASAPAPEGEAGQRRAPASPASPVVPDAGTFHAQLVNNLGDGVYYVDTQRRITFWNRGAERLTGYPATQVVGRACSDNILCHVDIEGRNLCSTGCPLAASMQDRTPREALVWLRHADGSRRPVHVRTAPILGEDDLVIGCVEIFSDATGLVQARDAAEAARRDALTDMLTGVPNRRWLDTVLTARKDDLERHGHPFGFLLVDIDHFKQVNDRYGHDTGDEAIRLVAETVRGSLRGGDTLARWGGEEFAVVASNVDADGLLVLAERIRRLVATTALPVHRGATRIPIRVSVGGAAARRGEPLEALFSRADRTLLAAKEAGRDRAFVDGATPPPDGTAPAPAAPAPRVLGARRV